MIIEGEIHPDAVGKGSGRGGHAVEKFHGALGFIQMTGLQEPTDGAVVVPDPGIGIADDG